MDLFKAGLYSGKAFINGQFSKAASGQTFRVINPFDGAELTTVADCNAADTQRAVSAANEAFISWRSLTGTERGHILRNWFDLQVRYTEELATLLTLEQGKPLAEARAEIAYGASFIEWFAEEAKRVYGDTIPGHLRDKRIITLKQPVGVAAAITPWNFPNAMITRKVAPALAAGCTVVVKPSELTPLSALALAALAGEAGFPPGVFNVVTTSDAAAVGRALTSSALVRKLSFTGSTATGKLLLEQCAGTVKKVSMELGGNAPFIVFDDADIDAAVDGAIASKYRNAGQTCVCANRIFVQDAVYDEFTARLAEATSRQRAGSGLDADVVIGPMISENAVAFVEELVRDARDKGAELVTGGRRGSAGPLFYEPTVLSGADSSMKVFSEEIFGPVAPVFRFTAVEEAIDMANNTPYGLAAYFYGRDHARIWKVAEALEYGMIGINTGMISTAVAPFGGIKESGFGREGSKYGMDEYLDIKYLCWHIG
jgi:succinate-semialdehyde dehydrogenase/glutarate-semialdehyde dehydrogenase